jgi:hypothetical protein
MKRLRPAMVILLLVLLASPLVGAEVRREIRFTDLPGYETLKCDLHMHTVFSDGLVWPSVRVAEAWRLGLDAIAITDHIEYLPHKDDVPPHHNRPFELASGAARACNLLFPKGAEITRDTPPGHFNAVFLTDVNPLDTPEFVESIKRANEQGAFVFWNHQGWKGPEKGRWMDVHTTLYENKWLHGMEVCNGDEYYPDAHRWCLEKNLTMLGNSDIHEPDLNETTTPAVHRTMTLVFVEERTLEGLEQALREGRTAVWYRNQVIARRELLEPFFHECVRARPPHLRAENAVWTRIENTCDLDVKLRRTGSLGPAELTLPARTTTLLKVNVPDPAAPVELTYTAANFLVAPGEGLPITLRIAE